MPRGQLRPNGAGRVDRASYFSSQATNIARQGGRVISDKSTGMTHFVSPAGLHWGSYDENIGKFSSGDLSKSKLSTDGAEDVTEAYTRKRNE